MALGNCPRVRGNVRGDGATRAQAQACALTRRSPGSGPNGRKAPDLQAKRHEKRQDQQRGDGKPATPHLQLPHRGLSGVVGAPGGGEALGRRRGKGGAGKRVYEHARLDLVLARVQEGEPALVDVSFAVQPGEVVALVGASGSGKSTVADLIARHLDPDAGCLRLDGHDLRTLRLADLRRQVVVVEQEPFLLHASLAERPSVNRIREAVGLESVRYFVVACPKDVTMYEDAVKTSGQEGRIVVRDLVELVEEAV